MLEFTFSGHSDRHVKQILLGNTEEAVQKKANLIRLFISSTFTGICCLNGGNKISENAGFDKPLVPANHNLESCAHRYSAGTEYVDDKGLSNIEELL